jgi:beta-lactamase class D
MLQEKAIKDEKEIIPWDGEKRWVENWNQDLNLAQAIDFSAVWFYQEGARRVGMERMKYWMDTVHYGNGMIEEAVDSFWLKGTTAITPIQQVQFLRQLYAEKLPFDMEVQQTVKRIMPSDSSQCCIIHAKTGWADTYDPDLGWYIGYVTRNEAVAFFALNINMPRGMDDAYFRKKITREILAKEGWWDGSTLID